MKERTEMNECWSCKHRINIPGNCHISCGDPDPEMTGNPHGIKHGWFYYPSCFDPVWKLRLCNNFQQGVDSI